MTNPSWENLSDFFDPDEFATEAVFYRDGTEIGRVFGIFDDPSSVSSLGEFDLEIQSPQFTCSEAGVSIVKNLDTVHIENKVFDVMGDPKRDGSGVSVVILATQNVVYNAGI